MFADCWRSATAPSVPGDPDRAHEATRTRARRSPKPPQHDEAAGDGGEAVAEIEEQFIGIMIATGLTRMTARVLTRLYLTDSGSLSASELAHGLRVSPASVSKAVGELERQSLIRRERDPGDRRDRYVIDTDAWLLAWMTSARQNITLAQIAYRGARTLGSVSQAGMRLKDFGDFFDHVGNAMAEAAQQWSSERASE